MTLRSVVFVAAVFFANTAFALTGKLEVSSPWARATPSRSENGVAYLTIQSPAADRLVSVSSPVAKKVELHTMSMQDMVMKMRPLAGLDIPAGQPVSLKPGGEHVMLLGLNRPLLEGQSFPLTLTFEKAGSLTVSVPVEKAGATGPAMHN